MTNKAIREKLMTLMNQYPEWMDLDLYCPVDKELMAKKHTPEVQG